MKKLIIVLFLIGITTTYSQETLDEQKIEQELNRGKVSPSEPVSLNNGELITEDKYYGLDGKPIYHNRITIDLREISAIETEFNDKSKIYVLKFISGSDKSILETKIKSNDLIKKKSTTIMLRINSELLNEIVKSLRDYKK